MAKYRLTLVKPIAGEKVQVGDSIILDVPHESWINNIMVREALEKQVGRTLNCSFRPYSGEWTITKLS